MLAKRSKSDRVDEIVVPPPRQRLFAQLNVRIEPGLDARFKRFCMATQTTQAQALAEALEMFLSGKGF